MKKRLRLSFCAIFVIGLMVACSKKDNSERSTSPSVTNSMSATVNGTIWVATSYSGKNLSGTIQIEGAEADGSEFTLSVPANATVGSHSAGGRSVYQVIFSADTTYSTLTTGTVGVTSITNSTVTGTFSGTFTNTTTNATTIVADGVFSSNYQ